LALLVKTDAINPLNISTDDNLLKLTEGSSLVNSTLESKLMFLTSMTVFKKIFVPLMMISLGLDDCFMDKRERVNASG
jgi:hypothetical protein